MKNRFVGKSYELSRIVFKREIGQNKLFLAESLGLFQAFLKDFFRTFFIFVEKYRELSRTNVKSEKKKLLGRFFVVFYFMGRRRVLKEKGEEEGRGRRGGGGGGGGGGGR